MGLLSQGSPLNWEETRKYADHIRKHGIIQFLNIYNKVKERQRDVLKWGDEVRRRHLFYLLLFHFIFFYFKNNLHVGNAALDVSVRTILHDAILLLY